MRKTSKKPMEATYFCTMILLMKRYIVRDLRGTFRLLTASKFSTAGLESPPQSNITCKHSHCFSFAACCFRQLFLIFLSNCSANQQRNHKVTIDNNSDRTTTMMKTINTTTYFSISWRMSRLRQWIAAASTAQFKRLPRCHHHTPNQEKVTTRGTRPLVGKFNRRPTRKEH